jgi:glycosyltransferase involved in cell wall biosynthesis
MDQIDKKFISIVVCTKNGSKKIKNCLDALIKQTYPPSKYEIILVDDGSTDNTLEIVSKYPIKIIKNEKNIGLAGSRNIGAKEAKGEIIAFTDDDCIPNNDWLEKLEERYSDESISGVGGPAEIYNKEKTLMADYIRYKNPLAPLEADLLKSSNIFYRFLLYVRNIFFPVKRDKYRRVYSLVGANMSFRKSILEKLNYFDGRLINAGEEEDVCKRHNIEFKNNKLFFTSDAIVLHDYNISPRSIFKRYYSYGVGNGSMCRKHTDQNFMILPFPILIIFIFLVSLFNPILLSVAMFSPYLFYFNWLKLYLKDKNWHLLVFPYVQFVHEIISTIGFIVGYRRYKDLVPYTKKQ